jgi:putative FmdB family regulatory protein
MPIYEYECPKCGLRFDAFDKFTDPTERSCQGANCDGTAKRVPSVPSPAVFKCSMPTYQKPKK